MDFFSLDHLSLVFEDETVKFCALIFGAVIILFLIRKWCNGGWCYSKASLKGKTVIVTGANSGIGKLAAHDFAKRGARVILACRNLDKAVQAAREIEKDSKGEVVVRQLDLASFKSIRKFVETVLSTEPKIDILVNNAGLICPKTKTEDNFDLLFQTNHLGPFLLTNLLLDKLKESSPSRIVNVSSLMHLIGSMDWDDLNHDKPKSYTPVRAYSDSKLANILFTKELAKKLQDTNVTTYAVHPGYVHTGFGSNMSSHIVYRIIHLIGHFLVAKSPIQGAQTTIYCAVSEELEQESGLYYSDCKKKKPSSKACDKNAAKKLWDLSAQMVGL